MGDNEIVELFLRRDEAAIERTAEKYGGRLRSLAYGIVTDRQTAEECENDAYLEAWDSIPPHEPRSYLYAFLARIVRHIGLDRCRERTRLKRSAYIVELSRELQECIPAPDDTVRLIDDMALAEAINGFLGGLSAEKRGVFIRRYFHLDSIAEISHRFGISESKVKSMLFRCRNKLRERLEKEGCEI